MDFESLFQPSLFRKHMQKCGIVEKMGRVKESTGRFAWAFNDHVYGWASGEETVARGGASACAGLLRQEQEKLLTAIP